MSLETEVREIVAAVLTLDDAEVTLETSRESEEAWDSASHVSLVLALEDAFGVHFSETEIAELSSVAALIDAIGRHRAAA